MKYDDVYEYIGQMGVYQRCVTAAMLGFALLTLDSVTMIFVGASMPHWCRVEELSNLSYSQQKYIAIPPPKDTSDADSNPDAPVDGIFYSSCRMYNISYEQYNEEYFIRWNRTDMVDENTPTITCNKWIYEQTIFISTIVSRFNLVCGDEYLVQLVSTLYMIGMIIGAVGAGALSDKIGRVKSMLISLLVKMVGVMMSTFGPNYPVFIVGRFILGVGSSACFITCYVLLMEIVGPRFRSFAGCSLQISSSIGFVIQPLIAMALPDDMLFQIAALMPNAVILTFYLVIPESPRWLLVAGKYKEADQVFRNMCRVNGTTLPDNFDVQNIEKDDGEQKNYSILFKSSHMRLQTVLMNIIWFFCALIYFAMALNVGYLPGDIYINTIVAAALEICAIIICIFLLDWKFLGRKWTAVGAFGATSLALLLCIPLDLLGYNLGVTILNIMGRSFVVIAYSVIYVHASEIFPTEVRNVALGVAQMFSSIGCVAAPYIGEPLTKVWGPLPFMILGVSALLCLILYLPLPETLGHPMFDTVEQSERYRNTKKVELHNGSIHRSSQSTDHIIDDDVIQENHANSSSDKKLIDLQSSTTKENIVLDAMTQPTYILIDENSAIDDVEFRDNDSRTVNEIVHRRSSKSDSTYINSAYDNDSFPNDTRSNIDSTVATNQNSKNHFTRL